MKTTAWRLALILGALVGTAVAQEARLRPAEEINYPTFTDGNSPSFWLNDRMQLFTSYGVAQHISIYDVEYHAWESEWVDSPSLRAKDIWIESAWADIEGTVLGWYHQEPRGLHADPNLTAPKIGALVSYDGGYTVFDLGIVLESGDVLNPRAKNGYFSGGHGDFSVVLDRERRYFYFFFTNYGGPLESQGVAMARLAFADRYKPAGRVQKFYQGEWREPGIRGRVTPLFPAQREWHHLDPDSFWGAAVHWNTHLNRFVMLLNHAAGEPGWTQEGIYISFAADPADPESWSDPVRLMDPVEVDGHQSQYYPQVVGIEPEGTDTLAGKTARFFLNGTSQWEISFFSETEVREGMEPDQTGDERPIAPGDAVMSGNTIDEGTKTDIGGPIETGGKTNDETPFFQRRRGKYLRGAGTAGGVR